MAGSTSSVGTFDGCDARSGSPGAGAARLVRRAAVPFSGALIIVLMLAGAYVMGAYVPADAPRVVATWGTHRDGRRADMVEVIRVRPALVRHVRSLGEMDARWSGILRVVVDDSSAKTPTRPIIGRYTAGADRIRFEPRFAFAPGVAYRVQFDGSALEAVARPTGGGGTGLVTHRFRVPAPLSMRSTRVTAVHPAADLLPSNLLRWYVEFSAPMEPGTAHEHVRLLDETGRPVEHAFLRVDEELWDRDRRRLTLFFDPGRVKRGVKTNLEMGRPLMAGHRYRLVIDAAWRDASGGELVSGFDKDFDVGPVDGASPDPARWRLSPPRAGTSYPLRVAFGEPLDHALALRMIRVETHGGRVRGRVELAPGDSVWTFVPAEVWAPGDYILRVDGALEDLAGNSLARVFDADRAPDGQSAEESAREARPRTVAFRVEQR
jgi:hypothetical protein